MKATTTELTPRPQPVEPKRFNASTFWLSLALTFFTTLVLTAVAMWFVVINIHGDARQTVVSDMQLVSKVSQQK